MNPTLYFDGKPVGEVHDITVTFRPPPSPTDVQREIAAKLNEWAAQGFIEDAPKLEGNSDPATFRLRVTGFIPIWNVKRVTTRNMPVWAFGFIAERLDACRCCSGPIDNPRRRTFCSAACVREWRRI